MEPLKRGRGRKVNADHVEVAKLGGLAPYFGGKKELARTLAEMIDRTPHDCYAEPFVGMGGVFFRRLRRPKVEVINDRARDVANLFRIIQRHPQALLAELRLAMHSRPEFDRLLKVDPETMTDVERGARFYILQRSNYGGMPISRCFPTSPHRSHFLSPAIVRRQLLAAHHRLEVATIECLPYDGFIRRYDRPFTLFYLDPPYWGDERSYGKGLFERADFERIAELLAGIKGRFILSINDRKETRAIFGRFRQRKVMVTYRLARVAKFPELIVTGP